MNEQGISCAVYTENGLETKPMEPAWNRRVFNMTEVQWGDDITRDEDGLVSLAQGTYHIVACSIVQYFPDLPGVDKASASAESGDPDEPYEKQNHPGYCMLKYHPSEKEITTGTITDADHMLPSMVDIYVVVSDTTQIMLEHQVGPLPEDVEDVYLQITGNESTNHAFARISIRKLA